MEGNLADIQLNVFAKSIHYLPVGRFGLCSARQRPVSQAYVPLRRGLSYAGVW